MGYGRWRTEQVGQGKWKSKVTLPWFKLAFWNAPDIGISGDRNTESIRIPLHMCVHSCWNRGSTFRGCLPQRVSALLLRPDLARELCGSVRTSIPQNPTRDPDIFLPFNARARAFAVLLRTSGDPSTLGRPAADVISRRDRGSAVFAVQELSDLVSQQLAASRFLTWLTSVFAGTALTLAVIGIYGLLAYWVGQRTREMGVRLVLGAERRDLLTLLMRDSLKPVVAGLALGAGAAVLAARMAASVVFFGVSPQDPLAFVGAAVILLAAAIAAVLVPTRRAASVDPASVLRGA